jgi:hypothetical protein
MGRSFFLVENGFLREQGPSAGAGEMPVAYPVQRIVTAQPSRGLLKKRGSDDQRTAEKWKAQLRGTAEDTQKAREVQEKILGSHTMRRRKDSVQCTEDCG